MLELLGLVGNKHVGKTTASDVLVSSGWHRFAYADTLREAATIAFNLEATQFTTWKDHPFRLSISLSQPIWSKLQVWGWRKGVEIGSFPETTLSFATPRQILQWIGTDVFRKARTNFWIETADLANQPKPLVVHDIRFQNEADEITRLGGILVKITRPGCDPLRDTHSSESGVSAIATDYVIENDRDIPTLHSNVMRIVSQVG